MELLIGIVLLAVLGYVIYNAVLKPTQQSASEDQAEAAPYKLEAPSPEPTKCGCGRSASGFCVGLHQLSDAEWAAHPSNPAPALAAEVAVEVPAKKTRKPRAAKAEKPTKVAAKKAAAKKAAKPAAKKASKKA
jgi:hypothetical protein